MSTDPNSDLLSLSEVAEKLGISKDLAETYSRRDNWPCIRFSRKIIRFEPGQVERIVAMYRREPAATAPSTGLPGQTARSRRRSA